MKLAGIARQIELQKMLFQSEKHDTKRSRRLQSIEESLSNWKINRGKKS